MRESTRACVERETVKLVWKDASAVATGWWTPMDAGAWPRTGIWQVIMRIKKENSAWERWGASPGPVPCVLSKPGSTVNLTPWEKKKWGSDLKWGYITQQKRWGQIYVSPALSHLTQDINTHTFFPPALLLEWHPSLALEAIPFTLGIF